MRHKCRVMRPPFSFPRKKTGVARPKERRSPLQASSSKSCNACRIGYLPSSVSKRLDYLLSSLSLCLQFATLTQSPRNLRPLWICADLLLPAKAALLGLAAICALSIAGDYTAPKQDSRAAADNRSRPNRIAEPMAVSVSNTAACRHSHSGGAKVIQARDCQSKPFSWGSKGDILFPRKENIPL